MRIVEIDEETAERYAVVTDYLRRAGTPVPTNDLWIAASAMQHGLSGGVNPSFLVEWTSDEPLVPPMVETVMVGASSGQGISFVMPARVLEEKP